MTIGQAIACSCGLRVCFGMGLRLPLKLNAFAVYVHSLCTPGFMFRAA